MPDAFLLPALYLASGALALLGVHRGVRRLDLLESATLLALPLAFVGPALFTERVYAPLDMAYRYEPFASMTEELGIEWSSHHSGDLTFQIIPWQASVRWAWSQGDWPLWNPFMLAGDSLAQSAQSAPYHPVNLLSLLLPVDLAPTYVAAMTLFLGVLSAFCWARELGCRGLPSMLAALAWGLGGFVVGWLGWPMGIVVAVFPLVTTAVRRIARRPGLRAAAILCVALLLVTLGGHPESLLHVVAAGAVYGLFEVVAASLRASRGRDEHADEHADEPSDPRADDRRIQAGRFAREIARRVGWAIAGGVAAGLLTAIYLLPIVEALPQTAQYHQRRAIFAQADHSVPWPESAWRATVSLVPFAFGLGWEEPAEGVPHFFVPASTAYIGSSLLGFALFGLFAHPWRGRWVLLGFAAVGVAAGASAPGVTHALAALPVFDLSIHKRWIFAAHWALATLTALGAEAWMRRPRRLAAACQLAVVAVAAGGLVKLWPRMQGLELSTPFLVENTLWLLLPALATALLLLARPRRGERIQAVVLGVLLVALTQRTAEAGHRYPSLDRSAAYPPIEALEAIPRGGEVPWRFVAVGWIFPANLGVFYGLEDIRGYQPMTLRRLATTMPWWPSEREVFYNRVHVLHRPFLDFLNVRWALARAGLPMPDHWRSVKEADGFRLVENLRVMPRAFVPRRVVLEPRIRRVVKHAETATDWGDVAWIERQDGEVDDRARLTPNLPPEGQAPPVRTTRRGTGLRLEVTLDEEAWIVVSEPTWEGWRAETADGRSLEVATANLGFLAIRAPAGASTIDLVYRPRSFVLGAAISGSTLVLLILGGWIGRTRARRRERRPVDVSPLRRAASAPGP